MAGLMPTWKPRIGLGFQVTWGTGVDAGDNVPTGGPKGIAPTNLPDLNPNIEFIESLKHHGGPSRISRSADGITEEQVGVKMAGTTIELDVDPVSLAPFMISLCEQFSQGATPNFNKTIINYDRATNLEFHSKSAGNWYEDPFLFSIIRDNSIADPALASEDVRIKDCVVRSMTLSGTRGEPFKASIEIIGSDIEVDFDASSGVFTLPASNATPLLFQNMTFKYADIIAGTPPGPTPAETNLIAFSLTLTNNLAARNYNSQIVDVFVPGRFDITGSITIPWRNNDWIDDFLANNPIWLQFIWGTPGTAPSIQIDVVARFNGNPTVGGDEEVEIELPFVGVVHTEEASSEEYYYPNSANSQTSFKCQIADGINYGA